MVALSTAASPEVSLLNPRGLPVDHLTDGDELRLRITRPKNAEQELQVSFVLADSGTLLGECTIEPGRNRCDSEAFDSLGWSWQAGGVQVQQRVVQARADGRSLASSLPVPVLPRPVVMVHGLNSDWHRTPRWLPARQGPVRWQTACRPRSS